MSVAFRFDRPIPSVIADPSPPPYRPSNAEAPDRGDTAAEAPEVHRGRSFEAPDAGEGRMAYAEHQFTHGRSQS